MFIPRGRLLQLGHNQCTQHFLSLELTWTMTVGISGIIVRDEAARQSFKEEIGRVGVTLYVRSFSIASATESQLGQYSTAKDLSMTT